MSTSARTKRPPAVDACARLLESVAQDPCAAAFVRNLGPQDQGEAGTIMRRLAAELRQHPVEHRKPNNSAAPRPPTCAELILAVSRILSQPFTREGMAVAVWQRHKVRFSLHGHDLPDTHKVFQYLYGERGLIARGMIVRLQGGWYRVAEAATDSSA